MKCLAIQLLVLLLAPVVSAQKPPAVLARDDGYRGIWYANQPSKDEYRYKYSGGFATYPQQQLPQAIYAKEVNKTFFCYGGRTREKTSCFTWSAISITPPAPCRARRSC